MLDTEIMVPGHLPEDGPQGAGLQRIVRRNGDMMLRSCQGAGEPPVGADLTRKMITKSPPHRFFQVTGGDITGQFHTSAITSSITR